MSTSQPPRLAHILVRARRLGVESDEIEADMLELFRARCAERGLNYARWRYWSDACSLWLHASMSDGRVSSTHNHRSVSGRFLSDLHWAWRSMRARSTASLAVMLILSFGIGLAATMFALADPYLLRPLPYRQPTDLVFITPPQERPFQIAPTSTPADPPTLTDWQARTEHFLSGVAAFGSSELVEIQKQDGLTSLNTVPVSSSFFSVLGLPVRPVTDWRIIPGQSEVPIIVAKGAGNSLGALLASPDGRKWRVAGFLPEGFIFPSAAMRKHVAALTPLVDEHLTQRLSATAWTTLDLIGRLKVGMSAQMANAALTPPRNPVAPLRPQAPVVEALTAVLTRSTRSLALGAAAAGLLIFLSCAANIANLLLTRVAYRTREFATRQALGATRFDLARLVLVELAGLMAAAIATGLGLAAMALKVINLVMPAEYASLGTPAIDGRSAVFACAIGSLAMLAGLVPAWVAWHVKTNASLGQLRMADGRGIRAMRFAMTAGQAAVAMVLMTGGCLLVRSYARLVNQDVGFSRDAFVIGVRYPSDQEARLLADIPETIARLRHVPGVFSVAAVRGPLANNMFSTGMVAANGHRTFAGMKSVTPAYADATGSVLTAGRFFTSKDGDGARVVNQAFARMCCTGQSAVGTIVVLGDGHQATIVGILKDAFDTALDKPPAPLILAPLPTVAPQSAGGALINYVFRAESTDQTFLLSAERQLLAVNPSGVVSDEATLGERLSHTVNDRSFATLVMTLFSVAALVVSATGLMGVVGFSVARRTREIAIRVAVGARSAHVRWLVAREAVSAASIGAVCGLVGGAWLSRTLTHFLYGIQPADPASLLLAVVAMAAVTASAATIPANKALRIAPTDALRSE